MAERPGLEGALRDGQGTGEAAAHLAGGSALLPLLGALLHLDHLGGGRFSFAGFAEFRFTDGAMVETGYNRPPIAYTRQPPPAAIQPTEFAGTYRSRDVDGELVVRPAGNGGLMLTAPFGEMRLDPVRPDGFTATASGVGHVTFRRGTNDAVIGLTISTLSGIARMQFERAR